MQEVKTEAAPTQEKVAPAARPSLGALLRLVLLRFPAQLLSGQSAAKPDLRNVFERELARKQAEISARDQFDRTQRAEKATQSMRLQRRVQDIRVRHYAVIENTAQHDKDREEGPTMDPLAERVRNNNVAEILASLTPEEQKKYLEFLGLQHPERGPST